MRNVHFICAALAVSLRLIINLGNGNNRYDSISFSHYEFPVVLELSNLTSTGVYTYVYVARDHHLKLLLSNFVFDDFMHFYTETEYCMVKYSTFLISSARNVSKTVRRRSFIILMLLISGNVSPNPGPFNDCGPTFKVPVDFRSRSGLGFIHMNVRSLLPKLDMVRIWVLNTSPDVLVISETWLNRTVSDKTIGIDGYTVYRADRPKRGGGVAVYSPFHIEIP